MRLCTPDEIRKPSQGKSALTNARWIELVGRFIKALAVHLSDALQRADRVMTNLDVVITTRKFP
jgi:hypothetical protein